MEPGAALAGIVSAARESARATAASNRARSEGPTPQAVALSAKGGGDDAGSGLDHAWMMLQQHDQLATAMETGTAAAFAGFSEAPLWSRTQLMRLRMAGSFHASNSSCIALLRPSAPLRLYGLVNAKRCVARVPTADTFTVRMV